MKVKIITIDPSLLSWGSLAAKLGNIRKALEQIKNVGSVTIEVVHDPALSPLVKDGRVTHAFMEGVTKKHTKDGGAFVILHMSMEQSQKLGIKPSLRGSAFMDNNFYSEAYFWSDEKTKRNGYSQFIETCLHEISHLLFARSGRKDTTHAYHEKHGTIKGIFKEHDYRVYQETLITRLTSWLRNQGVIRGLQPLVQRKANAIVSEMAKLGHTVHIFEGYRSPQRQAELYAQGRTTPGKIVTKAGPGESLHNYGVAVDIVFGPKGKPSWDNKHPWNILGKIGRQQGFEWGGDWKQFQDRPHFEMTLGYKLKDFQDKKVNYTKFQ